MKHKDATMRRKSLRLRHLGLLLVLAVTLSAWAGWLQTSENIDFKVKLIPQPNKDSCWAAAMAMLLSYRDKKPYDPESLAEDVGQSLNMSLEDAWKLLEDVRDRYGFKAIDVPSDTSLNFTPAEWAGWLHQYGPLWVVIVGAPHAVLIGGLQGDTEDPESCQVYILNPWDTRVEFDDDPVEFHPANKGYADWRPFTEFASDFGDIFGLAAKDDEGNDLTYKGNWRILYLPKKK